MSSRLERGTLIADRYLVIESLGEGTTGVVYSAWDRQLEREVAVKVLHRRLMRHRDLQLRFEHEIHFTGRLQHPGIVAVHEKALTPDGCASYIMAMARGQTLDEHLADLRRAQDPWEHASLIDRLNLFLGVLNVISYAHSQGIVHRDLKPANIIIGAHGEVRVIDWGLARAMHEPELPASLHETVFDELFGQALGDDEAIGEHDTVASGTLRVSDAAPPPATARIQAQGVTGATGGDTAPVQNPESEVTGADATVITNHGPADDHDLDATRVDAHLSSSCVRRETEPRTGGTTRRPPARVESSRTGSTSHAGSRNRSSRHTAIGSRNERSTRLGTVLGSPAYMSPEQARGEAKTADERSDIYSLGVILVELLSLHTPVERSADESLVAFIERVQSGERHSLSELWEEAPQSLERITEWALALDPNDRYPDCSTFRHELRSLLDELSASYAELEGQRLRREREAAWLSLGSWNYAARPMITPFEEHAISYEADPVAQVMHPELGGVLFGGAGLQVYPLVVPCGDDVRLSMDVTLETGNELCVFMRGVPATGCYCFRLGGYAGKWLTISRNQNEDDFFRPMLLTMRALQHRQTTAWSATSPSGRRRHLEIEVVGANLTLRLDGQEPLEVRDPCPLFGPMHRQLAIGTYCSEVVVHAVSVDRRHSPLMVPSFHIANELLRQNLFPAAIDYYRRFLDEHQGSDISVEARFMLCLAFVEAGHAKQAERELRDFLSDHLEHPLGQDAIFELARILVDPSGRGIARAAREVLSFQESGDLVRSRFCLWVTNLLQRQVRHDGLTLAIVEDLKLLRHLIRGFEDEELLLETIALCFNDAIREFAGKLLDLQAAEEIDNFRAAIVACREFGYALEMPAMTMQSEYLSILRKLHAVPVEAPDRPTRLRAILEGHHRIRDFLALAALGGTEPLLALLAAEELEPEMRVLRAAFLRRVGRDEEAQADLVHCYRVLDDARIERTSESHTATARLAFYALDYLTWDVVWAPIERIKHGHEYQALAAWLAECYGHKEDAAAAYRHLNAIGSGMCSVAEQGLARVGLRNEADGGRDCDEVSTAG